MSQNTYRGKSPPIQAAKKSGAIPIVIIGMSALFFGCGAVLIWADATLMADASQALAPGHTAQIMSWVGMVAAFGKALVPSAAYEFAIRWRLFLVLLAVMAGVLLHSYSMITTAGYVGQGRDQAMVRIEDVHARKARAQERYDTALQRIERMRATRDQAAIQSDLTAAEAELAEAEHSLARAPRWARLDLSARKDVKQGKVNKLRTELAEALKVVQARQEADRAREELDDIKTPGMKDPFAQTIANYEIGMSAERISTLLPLLPSSLIEFGGAIFWLFSTVLFGVGVGEWRTRRAGSNALNQSMNQPRTRKMHSMVRMNQHEPTLNQHEPAADQNEPDGNRPEPAKNRSEPARTMRFVTSNGSGRLMDDEELIRIVIALAEQGFSKYKIAEHPLVTSRGQISSSTVYRIIKDVRAKKPKRTKAGPGSRKSEPRKNQ